MTVTQTNIKIPIPLSDGFQVEAVWYPSGTLCLSTQVGCMVGCPYCASGRYGLLRNLSLEELQLQVETSLRLGCHLRRLTLSGIGEPLHNFSVTATFVSSSRSAGLPVSMTSSGAPLHHLESALKLPHNGLMLSLHAGTAETHRLLVPHGPDWQQLWQRLEGVLPALSRRARRRIGINYLLLAGVNDQPDELQALADLMSGYPDLTLHLLTFNPAGSHAWSSPPESEFQRIAALLRSRNINVRRANRWRRQTVGGCGTLLAGVAKRPGVC